MRENFLIGNFLPAYGRSFGRLRDRRGYAPGLTREKLAQRFAERERSFRERRRRYNLRIMASLAVSMLLVSLPFNLDLIDTETIEFNLSVQEVVQMEDIVQTRQVERPPPPPRPPVPVEVSDDIVLEDDDLDLDASLDLDLAPPAPPQVTEEAEGEKEPEVFVIVEQEPEMIGGMAALAEVLVYPPIALKAGIEGTVIVRAIIDEAGNPTEPIVTRSIHKLLDEEAKRALMLQKFKAARQRGRPVKVYFSVPVRFCLK